MAASGCWRTLDLGRSGAPQLLIKARFTSSGYQVQLTDLCRVWAEKATKRDLIRRSWDDGCSIDPSEDDQQFKIFLEKIEGALNGDDETTLDILPSGDNGLLLKLSAPLPRPLPTLLWTVLLERQADEEMAVRLTVPLLQQASMLQSQVQQLIHELQEKDRVISKITDRLETSGNDLTTVFPGVSNVKTNKKKSQREQLARHVKGLADFDETGWRQQSLLSGPGDVWKRAGGILRDLPEAEENEEGQSVMAKWWLTLDAMPEDKPAPKAVKPSSNSVNGTDSPHEGSMVDDEFQRQRTPTHLNRTMFIKPDDSSDIADASRSLTSHGQDFAQQNGSDSTTEDEDDLDTLATTKYVPDTSKQQPSLTPERSSGGPSKKLGAIGGRTSPPPLPAKQSTAARDPQPAKSRGKLGALGAKTSAPEDAPASSLLDDQASSASSPPRKMGVLGGKRKALNPAPPLNAAQSPEPKEDRSRIPTKDPTPSPRETSQERADRKRDELKKELEQKSKAPAKKKRKF